MEYRLDDIVMATANCDPIRLRYLATLLMAREVGREMNEGEMTPKAKLIVDDLIAFMTGGEMGPLPEGLFA